VPLPKRGEVVLLLASVLLFLAFAEVALRVSGLAAPRPTGYAPVDTKRRGMAPTNALGYRDDDHVQAKPPGVRRLVSLGDSFAWGASIEVDDTYARRVTRALGRTRVLNDSEDENAAEARRARDWVEEKKDRKSKVRRFLNASALYRLVSGRVYATIENRRRTEAYRSQFAPDYPGWLAAQKALKLMGNTCRERGIPLVVIIFPLFGQPLDDAYPFADVHARVSHAAGEAGARVVDLLPLYRGLRSDVLVVDGADDEHPNEIAHRIAATALVKALDDVLSRPPAGASPPA